MELFFFWLLMALVVALVANSKGRSAGLWFFYGLIIWPLALIHAFFLNKTVEALEQEKQKMGEIRCPNCAGWVYKEAKACPHCQSQLSSHGRATSSAGAASGGSATGAVWQNTRNLDSAQYKIFLSEKYNIQKNELFGKFVCGDGMFDALDDALAHADQIDRKQQSDRLERQKRSSASKMSLPPHLQDK